MKIKILGSGQDAGIPQVGCHCAICEKARKYKRYRRLGPSIAIVDEKEGFAVLIDVSPDLRYQLDMLGGLIPSVERRHKTLIRGILLTHGHFGHYSGLLQFGKESVDEKGLPVFCTLSMKKFLSKNLPFRLLIQKRNIKIKRINPGKRLRLSRLSFVAIKVPHRAEISDAVGYIIESRKKVIYIHDLDYWTGRLKREINSADIALLDGTFYSDNEIARQKDVPHPSISETIELLKNSKTQVYFTHINHTNPINIYGEERKYIRREGFKIAYDGLEIKI